ncbi:MAG: heme exporter protein CcmB [Acidimicrobiia bacterium]|nr:heme exporter protein CcmB [Acidimicrobiia bacterium]
MSGRSGFWTQALAIAKRDLLIESRGGEVFGVVLPFAAVAVFVVPLATDALATRLDQLAYPVYWLVGLLFGLQVALRQTGTETMIQRRTLALLGIDPAARFAGRSLAAALLMTGVMVAIAPLIVLFYDPRAIPAIGPSLLAVVGFAIGLSMLSTLAGDVTVGLRTRSSLAPLIVAPISVPLLIGASQTFESLILDRSTMAPALLLTVTVLSLAVTGVLTAPALEDATT